MVITINMSISVTPTFSAGMRSMPVLHKVEHMEERERRTMSIRSQTNRITMTTYGYMLGGTYPVASSPVR